MLSDVGATNRTGAEAALVVGGHFYFGFYWDGGGHNA